MKEGSLNEDLEEKSISEITSALQTELASLDQQIA